MIKCLNILSLLFIAACILFSSCTPPERPLKEDVNKVVNDINAVLDFIRKDLEDDRDFIETVYSNRETYDLATDGMDVDKGGKYTVSDNGIYYKPEDDGLCSWYYGFGSPDESVKKEIRLLENIEKQLRDSVKSVQYNKFATYISHRVYVVYPFYNIIEVFPPGFSFAYLEEQYKEDEFVWKRLSQGRSYRYCDYQIILPVFSNNSWVGIMSLSISMPEIAKKLLVNHKRIMMMVSHDFWLLGESRLCKKEFKLASIDNSDYMSSLTPEDDYSLLKGQKPEGIREMAEKIQANEKEFSQLIDNKSYNVVVADVPEVNYYIVGLEKQ